MSTIEDLQEQLSGLAGRLERIERLVRGQSASVPDETMFTYEEAAIYFVTAENAHWLTEEELDRARQLLEEHQMSARKMGELCKDETAPLPYRVKSGQSAYVPAVAVKEYKEALRADAVKARHRVES